MTTTRRFAAAWLARYEFMMERLIFNRMIRRVARCITAGFALALGSLCLCASVAPAQQHGYRAGCYNTIWPVDMANLNRSGTVVGAGLPQMFDAANLTVQSLALPFPVFTYTRDSSEVFVIGGTPYLLDLFGRAIETGDPGTLDPSYYSQFTPYLAKINPLTNQYQMCNLTGGVGSPYVGGAVVHQNGFVYAVARARLFKIDAATMLSVDSLDLPLVAGLSSQTNYNGLSVTGSGKIIAKATSSTDGIFLLINPDTLKVKFELRRPTGSARITVALDSLSNEYLYHLDQNQTYRFLVRNDSLLYDSTWNAAYSPYGTVDNDEPTSPVVAGGTVYYTTNTVFTAATAMKIFWQQVQQNYAAASDTLGGEYLFADTLSAGWNFFHLNLDDTLSGIVIAADQSNGCVAALRLNAQKVLERLWEKKYAISAKPAVVADRQKVYINDFQNGTDYFVVLDLLSGTELGRVATPATKPTIATMVIGLNNDVYYCSNEYGSPTGYFHRISLQNVSAAPPAQGAPLAFSLSQNYPNPFNPTTVVGYALSVVSEVKLNVFDVLGREVATLVGARQAPGKYNVAFNASSLPSGAYFYRLQAIGSDGRSENFVQTKKMFLVK